MAPKTPNWQKVVVDLLKVFPTETALALKAGTKQCYINQIKNGVRPRPQKNGERGDLNYTLGNALLQLRAKIKGRKLSRAA